MTADASASSIVLDQKAEAIGGGLGNTVVAQTFTVGVGGLLVGVDIAAYSGPNAVLRIFGTTAAGFPDSAQQLASLAIPNLPAVSGFQPTTFFFAGVPVNIGDRLAIVVDAGTGGSVNWTTCNCSYGGGWIFASPDLTNWQSLTGGDLMFRTYVDTGAASAVPEPETLTLFAIGLTALASRPLRARWLRQSS